MTRTLALTLRYLEWHIWRFGYAPTRKELAEAFDSTEGAMESRLRRLKNLGMIRLEGRWRGVKLV